MERLEDTICDLSRSLEDEKERADEMEGCCQVLEGKLSIIKSQLDSVRELMSQLEKQDSTVSYSTKKRKANNKHRSPLNRDKDLFDI